MKNEEIYKLQGYIGAFAMASGVVGYGVKGVLVGKKSTSNYIDFQYFMSNLDKANFWPYLYWISTAFFLAGLTVAMMLEVKRRKS
jgi:hypothetical protein